MDTALYSIEAYIHSLCYVTDATYAREEEGHLTVVVDLRRGDGWANMPTSALIPFAKEASKVLSKLYPDRTKRFVVYPVPWVATFLVAVVKKMLDPEQQKKLVLLSGDIRALDSPPADLAEYVTIESLPVHAWSRHKSLDQTRVSSSMEVGARRSSTFLDEDGGESFYSCSDGEACDLDQDLDIETGLLEVERAVTNQVRRLESEFQGSCSRLRLAWRWLFTCRMCHHRCVADDPHSR